MASTDSANPTLEASHGSVSRSTTTATPSARVPRRSPLEPSPTRATVPIAAARTTLGSARARSRNPPIPRSATARSPRPRTPSQRASTSTKPTSSVRLVPDTAVRCVSPVVRKSSTRPASILASSPTTNAGTSARWSSGRPRTEARSAARTASAARHQGSGSAIGTGSPRAASTAARLASDDGERRPASRTRAPRRSPVQPGSATTSTGTCTSYAAPRPVTRSTAPRNSTRSPNRPATSRGSPVTVTSAETVARSEASPATGSRDRRSARITPVASTASRTTSTPVAVLPGRGAEPRPDHPTRARTTSATVPAPSNPHGPAPSSAPPSAVAEAGGTSRASSPPAHAPRASSGIRRSGRVAPAEAQRVTSGAS